jgi:hypothetical protein
MTERLKQGVEHDGVIASELVRKGLELRRRVHAKDVELRRLRQEERRLMDLIAARKSGGHASRYLSAKQYGRRKETPISSAAATEIDSTSSPEKTREGHGFHTVTQEEMRRILDVNARKLVHMSGERALRAIRSTKRSDTSANWAAIRMLASMLD